jgi:lipoyl(octanoyl) transferase
MGVHISRWITRHGFALNVSTNLSYYDLIVPCGIVGRGVTSMQALLTQFLDVEKVAERLIPEFASVFQRTMIRMSADDLNDAIDADSAQTCENIGAKESARRE